MMNEMYRYRSVNDRLIESIREHILYFAKASCLNDPFDCQVNGNAAIERAINQVTGREKDALEAIRSSGDLPLLNKSMKNLGICCFTMERESSVMWSHYAEEHKGVCLGYQFSDEFMRDESNLVMAWVPMSYKVNPLTEWFAQEGHSLGDPDKPRFQKALLQRWLTVKDPEWEYEKEWRAICMKPGLLHVPKDALQSVCFGLRSSSKDEKKVRTAVRNLGTNVSFYRIQRTDSDFGIKAVKI
jgi:hypothetical protein